MPRIAASIVFPVSSPPRSNAVVEIDQNGTVLSVSRGGASFRELAGVEYYSGILIPGLADVMCGPDESGHRLLAAGMRVAGRVGWPADRDGSWDTPRGRPAGSGNTPFHPRSTDYPPAPDGAPQEDHPAAPGQPQSPDQASAPGGTPYGSQFPAPGKPPSLPQKMVPDTTGVTWRNRYGGTVGYILYKSMDHFRQYFRDVEVSGVCHFIAPQGELQVLAGYGQTGLLELMLSLQDGPLRYSLPELLTMATLNGTLATGYSREAGTISPGMRPGLNIIEGVDIEKMKLLPVSRIRRVY